MVEKDYLLGSQAAIEKAKKSGSVVVYPKPNQLQLDIDSDDDLQIHLTHLSILTNQYGRIESIQTIPSQRSGHWHVTLTFQSHVIFDAPTRLLLQAALGSDRKRELLGFMLHLMQDQHPTLFIEKSNGQEKPGDIRQ